MWSAHWSVQRTTCSTYWKDQGCYHHCRKWVVQSMDGIETFQCGEPEIVLSMDGTATLRVCVLRGGDTIGAVSGLSNPWIGHCYELYGSLEGRPICGLDRLEQLCVCISSELVDLLERRCAGWVSPEDLRHLLPGQQTGEVEGRVEERGVNSLLVVFTAEGVEAFPRGGCKERPSQNRTSKTFKTNVNSRASVKDTQNKDVLDKISQ